MDASGMAGDVDGRPPPGGPSTAPLTTGSSVGTTSRGARRPANDGRGPMSVQA
ncbi:hypothetical protein [Actinacidiphila guanduensis]|uniref:Uncharacterized protein n=1 Tax=Actinacidiphila guanduensis TaxID=310781 RepID=A0A1H0B0Z5_9ACTN|nr:hypothetical protein [Actinacidiphila guanduensis]SDN39352.1 hypothetical protein SAMN05216259_1046 [Actinacidiphila guanduensis]